MECRNAQEALNALVDGERLTGVRQYVTAWGHGLLCARCREVWFRLRRQRRLCTHLGTMAAPPELRSRVLSQLPRPDAARRSGMRHLGSAPMAGAIGLAILAVAVFGIVLSSGNRQVLAAEVGAAVNRVNTWHLVGWKNEGAGPVPWEVWGRREPYLYREEQGKQLLLDNGDSRLQVLEPPANGKPGKPLAIRMASQREPESARWTELTVGRNWSRMKPWQSTPDTAIFRGTDAGMQGPGTVAYSYFFVDRRTRLPRRWEYRHVKGGREVVMEMLDVRYDLPVPAGVTQAPLLPETRVIDASGTPRVEPQGGNVQQAGEVTAELSPVKVAPDGTVLARLRSWLGGTHLEAEGGALFSMVSPPYWSMTIDGKRHPWAITDDRGRPYVCVENLPNGNHPEGIRDGAHLLWLAPLEPFRPGDPLPRVLNIELALLPGAWSGMTSINLMRKELRWRVDLPEEPQPIVPGDYMVPEAQQRTVYKEKVPVEVLVAEQRAHAYQRQSDPQGCLRWRHRAIQLLPPNSDRAQFLRGLLASDYGNASDPEAERRVLREILAVKRRYPETWDYYARSAQRRLDAPLRGRNRSVRGAER